MKTDALIIGGGLAGAAIAYFLAKEGVEVAVVDRFDFNTGASGSNAGSLHIQIPHDMFLGAGEEWARGFAPVIPLLIESVEMWTEIGGEIEADLGVKALGGLLVASTEQQMRDIRRKAAIERAHGAAVEIIGRGDIRALAPYLADDIIGGAFCPKEGSANPLAATPGFASAAKRLGARVMRNTEVLSLARERRGFVAKTPAGDIRASRIVNCAGADAGAVAAMLGIELPVEGHAIQASVTEPSRPLVPHLVYAARDRLTLKQLANGTFLIGGGWPAARRRIDCRPSVDLRSLRDNLRLALRVVPALANIHVVRSWPAIVNGTGDWNPILGEVPGHPGVFMNMFPWMGFTAGPLSALIVAELMLGKRRGRDFERFSAARYA